MLTIDDLYRTMEDIGRTPVVAGIAAHPVLVLNIKLRTSNTVGMAFQDPPALTFLGTPLVEDLDIARDIAWVFYDRDLWSFYLRHRELQRDLREYNADIPFRFDAYVEAGLIIAADIRSLIDRS